MTDEVRPRRHSPAVYRRRRLVALLLALVVVGGIVAGVWALIAQPWQDGAPASASSPAPSSPAPTPSAPSPSGTGPSGEPTGMDSIEGDGETDAATDDGATEEPPAAEPCTQGVLLVEAVTDKGEYGGDEQPRLSIRLTNQGSEPCTLNVGTAKQTFTITSGEDTWWRSTDCQSEPTDQIVTIAAGQVVESAEPLVWDRTRSSVSTCDSDRQAAVGGGATYNLRVSIGGVESMEARQFFLY